VERSNAYTTEMEIEYYVEHMSKINHFEVGVLSGDGVANTQLERIKAGNCHEDLLALKPTL